jgi:hypothetical protein
MQLSVLSTLKDTLVLWMQHFVFFVLLAIFLELPESVISHRPRGDLSFYNVAKGAEGFIVPIILQAIGAAATLSFLVRQSADKDWIVVARGVFRYTGQLVGVQVFIALASILVFAPAFGIFWELETAFDISIIWVFLIEGLFVIFLKYALANPLVVAENLKAWPALSASWRMTKNRFGYVFGCYLIFGVIDGLIRDRVENLSSPYWMRPEIGLLLRLLGTYWFVLPWVMYLRIKAADEAGPVVRKVERPFG